MSNKYRITGTTVHTGGILGALIPGSHTATVELENTETGQTCRTVVWDSDWDGIREQVGEKVNNGDATWDSDDDE